MKISIVMPTYNSERFVGQAIESVVKQDYADYELIIVDGDSKDNTLNIIKNYVCDKVRYISEPDNGEPDAINKGMQMAQGDILAYLDSDDVYGNGCFRIVEFCFSTLKCKWLYGKARIINDKGVEIRSLVTKIKEPFQQSYSYRKLLIGDFIVQPTVFMTKDLYQKVGLFNVNEKLVFDYDYWLRCGKIANPYYLNDYLASWRMMGTNPSVVQNSKQIADARRIASLYTDSVVMKGIQSATAFGTKVIYTMFS